MHWLLEVGMFGERERSLAEAVRRSGQRCSEWQDDWWTTKRWPVDPGEPVLFHGSLGNAARIREELSWRPGAFCNVAAFACSSWYGAAAQWLVHPQFIFSTVEALCADPLRVTAPLGNGDSVFVRPDSPLKPFSGRVVRRAEITPRKLDHGFYYENLDLPIVLAPVQQLRENEWRFVIVDGEVAAGSEYHGPSRAARAADPGHEASAFAARVASTLRAPEQVYVLDVCETAAGLRLLELNPFSGADLYACDPEAVVGAITAATAPKG
jgi:hypothetical protein